MTFTPEDINGITWMLEHGSGHKQAELWDELMENAYLFTPTFIKQAERHAMASPDCFERFEKYKPELITLFNEIH